MGGQQDECHNIRQGHESGEDVIEAPEVRWLDHGTKDQETQSNDFECLDQDLRVFGQNLDIGLCEKVPTNDCGQSKG